MPDPARRRQRRGVDGGASDRNPLCSDCLPSTAFSVFPLRWELRGELATEQTASSHADSKQAAALARPVILTPRRQKWKEKRQKKEGLFHEFREFLYADSPRRSPPCALGYHGNKSGIVLRNKKTGDITFILKKVADEESIPSFLPRLWRSSRKNDSHFHRAESVRLHRSNESA